MTLTMSRTSRPPVCSEQELVAATRAGDDRAFEELYARYRDRISAFILSKVHDHGRTEDIAQEVFMSALRRLRGTDQAIAFKPWIYEIAKNACIDEFRRGRRAREVPLESDGEFVVDRHAAALSSVPTPSAAVESKQRLDDLRGAFGGLSANHHQLLVMREFEGLSYDEIGSRLDMSRQMVESGLFRARRKLSEEYQELATGQRCEQIQTAIDGGRLRSVTSLGLRDRRRFARHLAHCQPCRHAALIAGVDEALVKPRTSVAAKIAALLPFPVWRLSRRSRGARAASASGSHQMAGAGSAGLGSAGSAFTLGQAAATVAVVIAGAGGGLAVNSIASDGHHRAPATAVGTSHGATAAAPAARAKAAHARRAVLSHSSSSATTGQSSTKRRHRASTSGGSGSGGGGGTTSSTGPGNSATAAGTAGNAVKNTANNLASGAGKALSGVTSGVGKTLNGVTSGVGKTLNGVTSGVGKTVNGVTSGVGNAVNTLTQATGTATTPVGQAVGNATNTVGQAAGGATNGVTQAAGGVTSGVGQTVNGVTGSTSKTVNGATGGLSNAVSGATGATSQSAGAASSPSPVQPAASAVQQAGSILGH